MSLRDQAAARSKERNRGPEPRILAALRQVPKAMRDDVLDCIAGHADGDYDARSCADTISKALGVKISDDQVRRWINLEQCPEEWR